MPEPIIEVQLKPSAEKLRLEWGMPVQDGKWVWDQPKVEIRLYCRPYPDFGKPTLLNTDLDDLHTTYTGSGTFRIPFIDVTVGKEKSRGGFCPGMVAADPTGKYYPLEIDLYDAEIPAGGVVCYPAVEWPVDGEWLETPFDCWVVFGYTARGEFIPVHQESPYENRPEGKKSTETLPDDVPAVEADKRVRRRGATRRLFVSYSHNDAFATNTIVMRLNDEFYYDVWIDYDSIPGGSQWQQEIARGIQGADSVLFIATPGACASKWCQIEIEYALRHGKTIIPLRLTGEADEKDLEKIGLDAHQWIDFSTPNTDAAWQRLVDSLPTVTEREKYWLKHPEAQRLHDRYLRRFFKDKFMKISLADMMDDPPERGIDLLGVYVPLPVDMSVTVAISEDDHYTVTDWWVKTERSETLADEATPQELRGQKLCEWPALKVGQDELELLIDDIRRKLKERAAQEDPGFHAEQNWYMEAHDAAAIQPRMVLTGNPGSGKSTFVKHLAICMAGDQMRHSRHAKADLDTLQFWPLPAYTPLFISLRDLVSKQFPQTSDPAGTAQFELYVRSMLEADNLADYWLHLQRQLDDGEVIILLDGLDEVPNAVTTERRDQIIQLVDELSVDFERARMIITSRPYAYNGDWRLDGFGQTALVPLFPSSVYELAEMLFGQVLPPEDLEDEVKAFMESLRRINDPNLSNTPLLFTMMAAQWLRNTQVPPEERLPQRLSQLYRANVDLMLRRWTRKDDVDGLSVADRLGLSSDQLREAITLTGYRVQAEHGSDQEATFRQWVLVEAMEEACGGQRVEKYGEALDYLEQRAGLLTSEEARRYRFTHLSFQEHFAACYLGLPEQYPAQIIKHIQEQPGRWRNVIPLLADEIAERGGNLLSLVKALLAPGADEALARDHPQWEMVEHAHNIVTGHGLSLPGAEQQRLHEWVQAVVQTGALAPVSRAEIGRSLADLGDPRPGVLAANNVPDIAWSERIPAGRFVMGGDPDAWKKWDGGEFELDYDFWIAKYPVTVAQFEAFVESGGYTEKLRYCWTDAGWEWKGDKTHPEFGWDDTKWHIANHPIVGITWYEAYAFARWLDKLRKDGELKYPTEIPEDYVIRLPRECEWEKSARYPDGRRFPWGNDFNAGKLNNIESGINRTSAVGLFPDGVASCGAHDLSGNVWEWCLTKWTSDYLSPETEDNWQEGTAARVMRGGSWDSERNLARAASPIGPYPSEEHDEWGFRVVCSCLLFP